jgi:hypothetical protein
MTPASEETPTGFWLSMWAQACGAVWRSNPAATRDSPGGLPPAGNLCARSRARRGYFGRWPTVGR